MGKWHIVTSQAGTIPRTSVKLPTPSISISELRIYSFNTVSSKCCQMSGAGIRKELITANNGSARINETNINALAYNCLALLEYAGIAEKSISTAADIIKPNLNPFQKS